MRHTTSACTRTSVRLLLTLACDAERWVSKNRMKKSIQVFRETKDGWTFGGVVGSNPFEHGISIVEGVAHAVNRNIAPITELSHLPEFFCFGKVGVVKHAFSFLLE